MNTLPPSLVRFEAELEHAIDRRRRRPRRVSSRIAVVATAAAAIALGVLSVLPDDGPLGALPGNGSSAIALAAEALTGAEGEILHTVALATLERPDGTVETSRTETWQRNSAPYDERSVETWEGTDFGREIGSIGGRPYAYDSRTNTIYTTAPGAVLPDPRPGDASLQGLRDRMLVLLDSGEAREEGRITVDGREAIRIVAGGSMLLVDAESYDPIEWSGKADDGTLVTTRLDTYEWLPPTDANLALLSVTAQHPDARLEPGGITVEGF